MSHETIRRRQEARRAQEEGPQLPSPISGATPTDDSERLASIESHVANIDRIVTRFYQFVITSCVVGFVLALIAVFKALR